MELLVAAQPHGGATYVDATFGDGGHAHVILDRVRACRLVALDRDPQAVARASALSKEYAGRLVAIHANFADLATVLDGLGIELVAGVIFDLGLSSRQLSAWGRGFSFAVDQPLDMRFDPTRGPSAAELLATSSEEQIAAIIDRYGDERFARRIARRIVDRRRLAPLRSTADLVAAIRGAVVMPPHRRGRIHFATRTFMALRMAVNDEERSLELGLDAACRRTRPGGRVAAISFHSGEDRIVKREFRNWERDGRAAVLTKKAIQPSRGEVAANPRSRSGRLRAVTIKEG